MSTSGSTSLPTLMSAPRHARTLLVRVLLCLAVATAPVLFLLALRKPLLSLLATAAVAAAGHLLGLGEDVRRQTRWLRLTSSRGPVFAALRAARRLQV